jgi:catechol 2,3-dioxygenase-like lactoylglutathione lyase family enzyme
MRAHPLLVCRDVEASSRFYQQLLGCKSGHGDVEGRHSRGEYERLVDPRLHHTPWGSDGLILQLHAWKAGRHHGHLGDPTRPVGNGVLVWFEVDDFDAAVARARALKAPVILEVHRNPNAQHREMWITDPDSYTVVLASSDGEASE